MASFEVETYTVSITASSSDSAQPRMLLVSPDLAHGIRNRANLIFEPTPQGFIDNNSNGYATNVGGANFDGITIVAWMSSGVFDDVYDLIRNESPVRVVFHYKDIPGNPSSTTKYLTSIRVGTEAEVPGEGDGDPDAAMILVTDLTLDGAPA